MNRTVPLAALALATLALATLALACGAPSPSSDAAEPARSSTGDTPPSTSSSSTPSSSSSSAPPPSSSSSAPPPSSSSAPPPSSSSSAPPPSSSVSAPPAPAFHAVLDRETPYFLCTDGAGATFDLVMSTTDAIVIHADNSEVDGSVSFDAADNPVFAIGSELVGTAANEVEAEDMLLSFDVGAVHCDALAYELSDGFDAHYDSMPFWFQDVGGVVDDFWSVDLGHLGQIAATEDLANEEIPDDVYTHYTGVYFIDGGVIHAALLDGQHTFEGVVQPDHTIVAADGTSMSPSTN